MNSPRQPEKKADSRQEIKEVKSELRAQLFKNLESEFGNLFFLKTKQNSFSELFNLAKDFSTIEFISFLCKKTPTLLNVLLADIHAHFSSVQSTLSPLHKDLEQLYAGSSSENLSGDLLVRENGMLEEIRKVQSQNPLHSEHPLDLYQRAVTIMDATFIKFLFENSNLISLRLEKFNNNIKTKVGDKRYANLLEKLKMQSDQIATFKLPYTFWFDSTEIKNIKTALDKYQNYSGWSNLQKIAFLFELTEKICVWMEKKMKNPYNLFNSKDKVTNNRLANVVALFGLAIGKVMDLLRSLCQREEEEYETVPKVISTTGKLKKLLKETPHQIVVIDKAIELSESQKLALYLKVKLEKPFLLEKYNQQLKEDKSVEYLPEKEYASKKVKWRDNKEVVFNKHRVILRAYDKQKEMLPSPESSEQKSKEVAYTLKK